MLAAKRLPVITTKRVLNLSLPRQAAVQAVRRTIAIHSRSLQSVAQTDRVSTLKQPIYPHTNLHSV